MALNILANTCILGETPFKQVCVSPVSEDIGIALGSLYHLYHIEHGHPTRIALNQTAFGTSYSDEYIHAILEQYSDYLNYSLQTPQELLQATAEYIHEEHIIAWFQG